MAEKTDLSVASGGSTPKKRVRFKEDDAVLEFKRHEDKRPKGMDPMEALEGEINAVSIALDAPAAAAARARQRRHAAMALFDDTDTAAEEEDHAGAEEGYEEPSERFNEAGVPFEPFHLHQEHEQGYFDQESGSYVEFKRDEEEDAWVDSLPETECEVDREWLRRVVSRTGPSVAAEEELSTAQEVAQRKQRIAALLLPEETVLQALRRLGQARVPPPAALAASAAAKDAPPRRAAMVATAQAAFDELTEASSALMAAGFLHIHSTPREDIAGAAAVLDAGGDGGGRGGGGGAGGGGSSTVATAATAAADNVDDMFAEEEKKEEKSIKPEAAERAAVAAAKASDESGQPPARAAATASPAAGAAPAAAPDPMQGFEWDEPSGYLYNASLGCYFDPASKLFGEAASGKWYTLDAASGQYTSAG